MNFSIQPDQAVGAGDESDADDQSSDDKDSLEEDLASGPTLKATTFTASSQKKSYPASISVTSLLNAGKLIKPNPKNKVSLNFEVFDLSTKLWVDVPQKEVNVETNKFSSGAFREAFHATSCNKTDRWVLKLYNDKTIDTIVDCLKSSLSDHGRKQVQMHAVASQLTYNES